MNGFYLSVIHFFLKNKTGDTYRCMIQMFKSNFDQHFNLKYICIDFESGMLAAVKTDLPNVDIHCCRFHLGQSLMNGVKKFGLQSHYYQKDNIVGLWLKSLHGLAAITPSMVRMFYEKHRDDFQLALLPDHDAACLVRFQEYYEKYYVREKAVFSPKIWAGLMGKRDVRYTNNGSEAFHRSLSMSFCGITTQPNAFQLLDVLSDHQSLNIMKLQSDQPLKQSQLDHLTHERDSLIAGKISIQMFLKTVSRRYKKKLPIVYAPLAMSHISIFYYF